MVGVVGWVLWSVSVRREGTRPGFWDVRPTRADRSTATKLRVLTPLKDGSAVYLRYPWDRSEKPLPKFQVLRPLPVPLPTVPHRPTGGTVAIRPTFRITYSLRDRPDGTPRARDRFPPRGNTLGRLSLAQGRLVRPHTRTRTCPRQRPTRRPRARGGPTERTGSAPTFQSLLFRPPLLQERVANDVTFPAC